MLLQRLQLRKKLEKEAAFVLTNMAKMGLNNRKTQDETIKKENNKKIAIDLRFHLSKFKHTLRLYI